MAAILCTLIWEHASLTIMGFISGALVSSLGENGNFKAWTLWHNIPPELPDFPKFYPSQALPPNL